MSSHVIELNDAEIRVGSGTKIVVRSPGIAVVRDDAVFLGEQALPLVHLHPRQTYNRFWSSPNQDALSLPTRRYRHHADLVFAHLNALHEQAGKPPEVIFAVPGSFSPEQLSLLLGIAQACPFAAVGIVDSAVAGAAATAGPGAYLHIDMHLHHTVFTQIDVGEQVVRGAVETVEDGGLTGIHDAAAALIADTFVQQCRFDPLRHAESEQALYDQLPRCLQALSTRQETLLEIRFQNTAYQAKLGRAALLERLEARYLDAVARVPAGRTPLLSDRVAALPGFAARLPRAAALDPEALFRACAQNLAAIRSAPPNLNFVTRLPAPSRPSVASAPAAPPETGTHARTDVVPPVTHLLVGHRAYPLRANPIYLSAGGSVSAETQGSAACAVALDRRRAAVTPLSDISIYVNGERLAGPRMLGPGDKLSFAGADTVYTLISMTDPDGA